MKIDINIISVLLVALTIFPYFLLPYLQYQVVKKIRLKFTQEAENHNLNIDIKESWNFNIIGADLKQKKLLFVQKRGDKFISEIINFSKVEECIINPEIHRVKYRGKEEDILYRIDLEFSLNSEEKVVLNLYDCDINHTQDLEMKHAQKWCNIIREHLSARPILKHSA